MKFENSEKIKTKKTREEVVTCLEEHVKKISEKVAVTPKAIIAESIEATFGSINRRDVTRFIVEPREGGFLISSETNYKPSGWFWIFFVIGLFFWLIGAIIPLIFYFVHKNAVKDAIDAVLHRVQDEVED